MPPPFTTPNNQSPADSHIYGKEREVFLLFRYFRVATNFEPAWGGRLTGQPSPYSDFLHAGYQISTPTGPDISRHFASKYRQLLGST